MKKLKGTPWAPDGDDREKPIGIKIVVAESLPEVSPPPEAPTATRREYLKKSDFDRHGYTTLGCPGCAALMHGRRPVAHSEVCRIRIQKLIGQTPKGADRL